MPRRLAHHPAAPSARRRPAGIRPMSWSTTAVILRRSTGRASACKHRRAICHISTRLTSRCCGRSHRRADADGGGQDSRLGRQRKRLPRRAARRRVPRPTRRRRVAGARRDLQRRRHARHGAPAARPHPLPARRDTGAVCGVPRGRRRRAGVGRRGERRRRHAAHLRRRHLPRPPGTRHPSRLDAARRTRPVGAVRRGAADRRVGDGRQLHRRGRGDLRRRGVRVPPVAHVAGRMGAAERAGAVAAAVTPYLVAAAPSDRVSGGREVVVAQITDGIYSISMSELRGILKEW